MQTNSEDNIAKVQIIGDPDTIRRIIQQVTDENERHIAQKIDAQRTAIVDVHHPYTQDRISINTSDVQLLTTIVFTMEKTAIERSTEEETVYKSVIDDESRRLANEAYQTLMKRIIKEVKLRG